MVYSMKHFKVSLLITTFNWPEALDLVLQSVAKQTCSIADHHRRDGSRTNTESVFFVIKRTYL